MRSGTSRSKAEAVEYANALRKSGEATRVRVGTTKGEDGEKRYYVQYSPVFLPPPSRNNRRKKKGNPAGTSEKAYEEFHGRPSMETVTIKRKVHYHSHLAAAGELQKLVVISHESGQRVTLKDFEEGDNPAILCFNEKGTQLFIEGGDQRVDLEAFGVEEKHENYVLGEVKLIEYFTRKDHLGSEGGTAIYVHKFERPYPTLMYDAINEQLSFSGGGYTITPEGIDH